MTAVLSTTTLSALFLSLLLLNPSSAMPAQPSNSDSGLSNNDEHKTVAEMSSFNWTGIDYLQVASFRSMHNFPN
jgi:hypothetical protein